MQAEALVVRLCGFEDDGRRVRAYFDEPAPLPALGRQHGVRSGVFRDLTGPEAHEFRKYVACNPGWAYLQVYPAAPRGPRGPVRPSHLLGATGTRGGGRRHRPREGSAARTASAPQDSEPGRSEETPAPGNPKSAAA